MSDGPRVALTFDAEHPDRPHHGDHAGWVLDELRRLDVRASVFLQGRWVEAFPDLARRVAAEGHLVGHHSFYHARMPLLSDDGFAEDVREAERVIIETTGIDPRPWAALSVRRRRGRGRPRRAPAASSATGTSAGTSRSTSGSPGARPTRSRARAVDGVLAHGDGAIVLLHTWPDPVAPALAEIVERLRDEGARFVGVDELDLPDGLTPVGQPRPPLAAPTG